MERGRGEGVTFFEKRKLPFIFTLMHEDLKDKLFYNSNKGIFNNANTLRKVLTGAEDLLWQNLRNRKFNNLKFRRQHPINNFIADFYCPDLKLVIEVDGNIHNTSEAKEYDAGRTYELNDLGIKVLRYTNDEIEKDLSGALNKLREFIKANCL